MKNKVFFVIGILTALLTVAGGFVSCDQTSASVGRLIVNITDAPSSPEIDEVWLTITGLQVHLAGSEDTEEEEESETGNNGGWIDVVLKDDLVAPTDEIRFNLLTLQNGLQEEMAEGNLDPGTYTQLRMDVKKVELHIKGAPALQYEDAKLPSNVLKFVHPFEIVDGEDTELLFDFDALKSVNETGNGKYIFKPVIKLMTTKQPGLQFDTGITGDSVSLPGTLATQFTLQTGGVAGTMHTIGLIDTVATPALADGAYGFTLQADAGQQTTLTNYFAAKGWSSEYITQIGLEINGTSPFFYLNAAGGIYTLVDGFKQALGISPATLTIDDDYPVGTYIYTGTLTGINGKTLSVTVTLVVTR